jgi:glycosyltransferase involved in cell wall biosynthesis
MKGEIERFIASRQLKDKVHFGGFLPHRELIKEVKKADLVIFPSLYESQPMFVLEAMACKKPVVAFDLPYAREMILNGKNGLLAKANDQEDLCDKTASALCDKNLRMSLGQNGYDYVKRNHDWDVQAGKYFKVYEELVADGKQ